MHSTTAATTPTMMPTSLPVLLLLPAHRLSGQFQLHARSGAGDTAGNQHVTDRRAASMVCLCPYSAHWLSNEQHSAGCDGLALACCPRDLKAWLCANAGVRPLMEDIYARWAAAVPLATLYQADIECPTCTLVVAVQAARHAGEAWLAGLGGQDLDAAGRHAPCEQVGLQPQAGVQHQAASWWTAPFIGGDQLKVLSLSGLHQAIWEEQLPAAGEQSSSQAVQARCSIKAHSSTAAGPGCTPQGADVAGALKTGCWCCAAGLMVEQVAAIKYTERHACCQGNPMTVGTPGLDAAWFGISQLHPPAALHEQAASLLLHRVSSHKLAG